MNLNNKHKAHQRNKRIAELSKAIARELKEIERLELLIKNL